jgi:hypothetical protein
LRLPLKKKLSSLADLPAHIVLFRGQLARLTTAGQAPLAMRTDCSWRLCPLSPFSTSILYCLRRPTGQLHSRRSRPMLPTSWASIPTSSPTPPFDPSRETSKGTRTERASVRMGGDLVYPTPPPTFTLNTPLQTPCSLITSNPNHILPTNFYPPLLALGSTLTPTPWPMVSTHTPAPAPAPSVRQERQQTARQETRQERSDTA